MAEAAWDREADLVVLGAGAAGMTTALVAALEGLQPLLVEKTAQVGGTMSTSAGTIWIPGNRQSRAAGFDDTAQAGATYMDQLIGAPDHQGLRAAYLSTGPDVVDYLHARTEVRFVPSGRHPDYRDLPGAAVSGRALAPETFDARVLGRDFERVRPPIPEFMVLGGMMAGKDDIPRLINRFRSPANFFYAGGLFLRGLGVGHDGVDDALVPGAPAHVALEPLAHLLLGGGGVLPHQAHRAHQHPGGAVAALQAVVFVEGLLHGVQGAVRAGEALHGVDAGAVRLDRKGEARQARRAVEMHRAATAGAVRASDMHTGQAELLTQDVGKQPARLHVQCLRDTVYLKGDLGHCCSCALRQALRMARPVNCAIRLRR